MDSIKIGGYKIVLLPEYKLFLNECTYAIKDIPEELCAKMVKVIDQGSRWANSSRYVYLTEYDKEDELQCGTAKAAVQRVIINKLHPQNLKQFIRVGKL
jgi:hypothetical protein